MNTVKFFILAAICCAGSLVLATRPASAETARSADYRLIAKACVPEVARYCPALEQSSYASRSQAICLKPYLSNLSLGCRHAVKAVYK